MREETINGNKVWVGVHYILLCSYIVFKLFFKFRRRIVCKLLGELAIPNNLKITLDRP